MTVEDTPKGEREYSEVEEAAMSIGWNPDFEGDGAKSALEYIQASREINDAHRKRVKSTERMLTEANGKISKLESVFSEFQEMVTAESEAKLKASEAKIAALQRERDQALDDEDVSRVRQIENKIKTEAASIQKPKEKPKDEKPVLTPEFKSWLKDNPWYNTDWELQAYADTQSRDPKFSGWDFQDVLEEVTTRVRKQYPEKFGKVKQKAQKKTAVEPGGGGGGTRTKKVTYRDLPEKIRSIVDNFVDTLPDDTAKKMGTKAEIRQQYIDNMVKKRGYTLE